MLCINSVYKTLWSTGNALDLKKKNLRGLYPASELYRPSDRRLLAKLVPTFAERLAFKKCSVQISGRTPDMRLKFFHGFSVPPGEYLN
jgi:hypothetical protein